MRSSRSSRVRRIAITLTLGVTASVLAACSHSAGVHLQNGPTDPTTDSAASANTAPPTATTPSTTPTPSWTPPDYGSAQPAVDAYMRFSDVVDKLSRDPEHVSLTTMDPYLGGRAKILFDDSYTQEKEQGHAYRGAPQISHVTVISNRVTAAQPQVVLRDCATKSRTDPYVEYDIATGRTIPEPAHNPPGPFAATIPMLYLEGKWIVTDYVIDDSATCRP